MDPRQTPCNGHVAATSLRGLVDAAHFTDGTRRQIIVPVTDLNRTAKGPRDRQLLYGDTVTVFENIGGQSYLQSLKDGYCGYVATADLDACTPATHWISAPSTHVYKTPDIKSADLTSLSFGSHITAIETQGNFVKSALGYIPKAHLSTVDQHTRDPTEMAKLFLGTPYLWGGNSRFGIDCSGLIQAAWLACNLPCPGDSDQQVTSLGNAMTKDTAVQHGDLLFWLGHVALALGSNTLIHANAHHMAVVEEDIQTAITRIAQQNGGPVTAHIRP